MLMYICAKFGACITECTIILNIWAKPPHYIEHLMVFIVVLNLDEAYN